MKLKRLALLFPVLAALVLMPTGAYAKDKKHKKHKHSKHEDRNCRHDDDRRYGGRDYYGRSDYGRSSYYAPSYYSPYRSSYDRNCSSHRSHRNSGLRLVFGF